MNHLREHHLGRVAHRLASVLPGADDTDVQIGARERLDEEMGRLLVVQAIRRANGNPPFTYAQALATCALPMRVLMTASADEAITVLIAGLSTPSTLAAHEREQLPADTLVEDLRSLLHKPALRLLVRAVRPENLLAVVTGLNLGVEAADLKALRLAQAVSMRASFNAARRILADPQVTGWQVPGDVVLSGDEGAR